MLGRGHTLAALALVLTLALGGCISNKKDAPLAPAALSTNATNVTAPDGRGAISAFNETNKTETKGIGAMMHTHDFWHGKERLDNVAWVDAGLIPFPLAPCKKPDNSCTIGQSTPNSDTYPVGTAIADFDLQPPPSMGMVYEGTKTVEVKMTKYTSTGGAPGNPLGHVFFDYLAANDEPGHFRTGGELKLNEPFKIEIKPTDADMPHQTKSLWVLRIYSDSQMVNFAFNITLSLVKGYDVVNWPPHPNLYADKPTRVVYDGPVKLSSKGSFDNLVFGSDAGWLSPQKVISWGTDRVEVEVKNVKFASTLPTAPDPKVFVLQARNASSPALVGNFPNWLTAQDPGGSPSLGYHFTIDLTKDRGDAMDTPYAQYSRWGFRLVPQWDATGGCPTGLVITECQPYPWDMSYDIRVVAIGHSTAEGVPAGAT